MSDWSLAKLLEGLHHDVEDRLSAVRKMINHPGNKGKGSEQVWLDLLQLYLPKRYSVASAHIVDSEGCFSDQIDIVIFDQQFTPYIFNYLGQVVVPAESVYAVFEVKQTLSSENIKYAQEKIASVRKLKRTSRVIPHAGGVYPPKPLFNRTLIRVKYHF